MKWTTAVSSVALSLSLLGSPLAQAQSLQDVIDGEQRSAENAARDKHRHPLQTLEFFEVEPNMTVVEIWPGGGWYTEILAPYLRDNGKFYAAHFPANIEREYYQRSRANFLDKMQSADWYDAVEVTEFSPTEASTIAPAGSVDRVLTFRNLHNWYMQAGEDGVKAAFKDFYKALKPGGILGVVDHRLPEDRAQEDAKQSGYIKQSWAIQYAEEAGFELVATSEINANSKDSSDWERGVWTLPPTYALGDEDRDRYEAIGESDRFTLKFKKPEE
ncbi:class I SAM-dependent methyltransferase [Idiomarina xiamenensis]|uniref:O-methyltransferase n=1 Tax=Idiomarina xiamenensis 10-D-4 TaxID=740709 RepID=K2KPZ4_9GAMM|nr:class I SAM-dependent methyltransferase [Idiomarina xiamenensis]EKE84544.1 O-methyltransferase [Idiomarina xiamenensis 10-D-4]